MLGADLLVGDLTVELDVLGEVDLAQPAAREAAGRPEKIR
jgi:hypothetical protein